MENQVSMPDELPSQLMSVLDRRVEDVHAKSLVLSRRNHPAWLLLASRRAALVIACLRPLFSAEKQEILVDDAREKLAALLGEHANNPDFEIEGDDFRGLARRELREWIRQGLLAERDNLLFATDALQMVFGFVDDLDSRVMTSTASRLSTVQQKIEKLEAELNPDRHSRERYVEAKIAELQAELARVKENEFTILEGARAQEEIRELYSLAMGLRSDFRRVEDSYREADRQLRQSLIAEDQNRGTILDRLLNQNDALLDTPEGRVFDGFHRQISQAVELDQMRIRLRSILATPAAGAALDRGQTADLRALVQRLLEESAHVMRARARSERDVRGFIKSGLAGEHHRVGRLLQQLSEAALAVNWTSQEVRRAAGPLPPLAPAQPLVPVPERLCFKSLDDAVETRLDLERQQGGLEALEQSLLETGEELDRDRLHRETVDLLRATGYPLTLGQLAHALPPRHDLETFLYWLTVARETDASGGDGREQVELRGDSAENKATRFDVPNFLFETERVAAVFPENLE